MQWVLAPHCAVSWGQEGHIPFPVSLMLHTGAVTAQLDMERVILALAVVIPLAPLGTGNVRVLVFPGVWSCLSVPLGLLLPSREGPDPLPPALAVPAAPLGMPTPARAEGTRSPVCGLAQGWPGAGAVSRVSAGAGAGSVGRSRAVPMPLRGAGRGRAVP